MEHPVVEKVVCYVTFKDQLLIITYVDYPLEITGFQVPAGTLHLDEDPQLAAVRELYEETGLRFEKNPVLLGEQVYDMRPTKNEVQRRYYFHFEYEGSWRESWFTEELHDGEKAPTKFKCSWIPIQNGQILGAGRASFLWKLVK